MLLVVCQDVGELKLFDLDHFESIVHTSHAQQASVLRSWMLLDPPDTTSQRRLGQGLFQGPGVPQAQLFVVTNNNLDIENELMIEKYNKLLN